MKAKKLLKPAALVTTAALATTAVVSQMATTFGEEENEYRWVATAPDTSLKSYSTNNILEPGQVIERYINGVKTVRSSNTKILNASYVKDGGTDFNYRVTAQSQPGIATVSLANKTGALVTTNYLVKNSTNYIESYELKNKGITLSTVGDTADLAVYVDKLNDESVTEELWSTITWTSYDEHIAEVTTDGKVTSKSKGETVLRGAFIDCYGEQENILFSLSVAPSTGTSSNDQIVTINGKQYIDHGDNTFTIIGTNGILGERVGGGEDHDPTTDPVHNIVIINGKPYIISEDGSTLVGVGSNGLLESNSITDIVGEGVDVQFLSDQEIIVPDEETGKIYKSTGHNIFQEVTVTSDGTYVPNSETYIIAGQDRTPGTDDDNLVSGRTTAMGGQIAIRDLDVKNLTYKITGAKDRYTVSAGVDGLLGTYDDPIVSNDNALGVASYSQAYNTKAKEKETDKVWHVTWLYMGGPVSKMQLISEYNFYDPQQWYEMEVDEEDPEANDYAVKTTNVIYSASPVSATTNKLYKLLGTPYAVQSQTVYRRYWRGSEQYDVEDASGKCIEYSSSSNGVTHQPPSGGWPSSSYSYTSPFYEYDANTESGTSHIMSCTINHIYTADYTKEELYAMHVDSTCLYKPYDTNVNTGRIFTKDSNSNPVYFVAPSVSEMTKAYGDIIETEGNLLLSYRRGRSDINSSGYGEFWMRSLHNNKYMHACSVGEDGVLYGVRKIYETAQIRPTCYANLTTGETS